MNLQHGHNYVGCVFSLQSENSQLHVSNSYLVRLHSVMVWLLMLSGMHAIRRLITHCRKWRCIYFNVAGEELSVHLHVVLLGQHATFMRCSVAKRRLYITGAENLGRLLQRVLDVREICWPSTILEIKKNSAAMISSKFDSKMRKTPTAVPSSWKTPSKLSRVNCQVASR